MKINTDPPIIWENPFKQYPLTDGDDIARADVLISVYRSAVDGIDTEYGGIGGYKDLEIMIGIRESAMRNNVPIQLPITGELEYDRIQHKEYKAIYGHDPLEIIQTPVWKRESILSENM